MIEYGKACIGDISSLKELWLKCFDENIEVLEKFFNIYFSPDTTFVARHNHSIIAMLYMLPSMVNGHKCGYMYAVATTPDYRGKGIMTELMDYAINNSDIELCLTLPANDSLYDFYKKSGFRECKSNISTLNRVDLNSLSKPYKQEEILLNTYCGIRNRVLKNNFLFWNNKHIDFAFEHAGAYGLKVIKNPFGYAVLDDGDTCSVCELICTNENTPAMLHDILSCSEAEVFTFNLSPNQTFLPSAPQKHGMVKFLTDYSCDNIYMGLTLD